MADLYLIASCTRKPLGHIIFVHGLGGHPFETFQFDKRDIDTLWPRWIAEDAPGLMVWTMGYQAPPTNFTGNALNLQARAQTFFARLTQDPRLSDGLPIIFVCHSLGGLVVKQLLRSSNEKRQQSKDHRLLLKRVKGLVFLGTPHSGARIATWADWLRFIVNRSQATLDMTRNNPMLDGLNNWFRNWESRPATLAFYETVGVSIFGRIVEKPDGDPHLPNVDAQPIERDHFGIVKPADRHDLAHIGVVNLILNLPEIKRRSSTRYQAIFNDNLETKSWQRVPVFPRIARGVLSAGILAGLALPASGLVKEVLLPGPLVTSSVSAPKFAGGGLIEVSGTGGGLLSATQSKQFSDTQWHIISGSGSEKSECKANSGRSISTASSNARVSQLDSFGIQFDYQLKAHGGHYRTVDACVAGVPVGLHGNDTTAEARATLSGEYTFEAKSGDQLTINYQNMPDGSLLEVSAVGSPNLLRKNSFKGTGSKTISLNGTVLPTVGKIENFKIRTSIRAQISNSGACCPINLNKMSIIQFNSADAPLRRRISGDPGPLGAPFWREMVPQEGFEPPTPSLRMMCSTN
jgi:pimeloyl-ACP methyl ester carboxylesterase